jgi:hypothetical protein
MRKVLTGLLIGLFSLPALASYISLQTTLRSKVEGNRLIVLVQTVNKGDESAFAVQAQVQAGGRALLAEKRTELPVNAAYQARVSLPLTLKTPGTYPLMLVLHYADANQYPFSALSIQPFVYRREAVPPLLGQMRPASFAKEGEVNLILKNTGQVPLKTMTRLIAPRELTVTNDQRPLALAPRAQATATFRLSNFSALAGSTYQVYAVTEFEAGGLHYTGLIPGTIKIIAEQGLFGLSRVIMVGILIALIALFVGAQFIKRGK